MSLNNNIWNDMARFLSDEMDEAEKTSLQGKVNRSHRLKSQFEKMKNAWAESQNNSSGKFNDTGRAWKRLTGRLKEDGLLENTKKPVNNFILHPAVRIAASVLLIVGLSVPAVFYLVKNNNPYALTISQSSHDGVSALDLPDGSRVYMNEGSRISYPEEFNENRTLKLEGEAFFEVMANPESPFRVHSGQIVVSVLGTSFNVKQLTKSNAVEIYVESGTVRVSDNESKNFITLSPGEMGVGDGKQIRHGELKDPNYLSWKTKKFIFVDEDVANVFRSLESAYHINIETGNLDTGNMKLTSTYMQQSVDAILETISTAFGLDMERKGKTYYLITN